MPIEPFPPCRICSRPVSDRRPLCLYCGERLVADLHDIPALLADLTITQTGQARLTAHVGARSAEIPLPIRSIAGAPHDDDPDQDDPVGAELVGDVAYAQLRLAVTKWADRLADHQHVTVPIGAPSLRVMVASARAIRADGTHLPTPIRIYRGNTTSVRLARRDADTLTTPATVVEQAAMWLANDPAALRDHDRAHHLYSDITRAVRRIRSVIDRPRDRRYIGACQGRTPDGGVCGTELLAGHGETWVRCQTCTQQSRVADVLRATLTAADPMLVTLDEALQLLERVDEYIPRGTAHSWISRRQLTPRAWRNSEGRIVDVRRHRGDEPMYPLGDFRRLRLANPRKGMR
ncbi:hypothetical protein [Nocardia wallacei]|uniref:hypothetical protein n=1 Tax=Nocardia wallacei TaxID=480035 RepID=UPI002453AE78|nr:hypothetical protein [Nocardia wallacei]